MTTKQIKVIDWLLNTATWGRMAIVALALVGSLLFNLLAISGQVSANNNNARDGATGTGGQGQTESGCTSADGDVKTSIIPCEMDAMELLVWAINIMTVGVGVLAVAGIAWGAIMYASAGGSQEKTKKGIEIIRNVVFGLLLYVFLYAIVNFLLPGNVLD